MLFKRIIESSDGFIGEEQCDFMSGRDCVFQIFTMGQVCELYIQIELMCTGI